jgi:hypothetical protein
MTNHILLPCAAMVGLTAVVWAHALYERIAELRLRRIPPQSIATSRDVARLLKNTRALDNFSNLFELPVLFYVLCLALLASNSGTPGYVTAAWIFVALRMGHSVIHVTYNRVFHRFAFWVLGALWLFGMWGCFIFDVLSQ